jgi:hypothetical protein
MKCKGPARDLKKERFWRGILRQQRQGGLTIRDFCRQRGLTEPLFYAWRRELQRRDRSSAGFRLRVREAARPQSAPRVRPDSSKPVKPRSKGAAFVPVKLLAGSAPSLGWNGVECLLPGGAVLRFPPGMTPAAIAALVHAWEQGRC